MLKVDFDGTRRGKYCRCSENLKLRLFRGWHDFARYYQRSKKIYNAALTMRRVTHMVIDNRGFVGGFETVDSIQRRTYFLYRFSESGQIHGIVFREIMLVVG